MADETYRQTGAEFDDTPPFDSDEFDDAGDPDSEPDGDEDDDDEGVD